MSYSVLRWFDRLPEIEPGEDIDLLVADEHIEVAEQLLQTAAQPDSVPVDLYSVSGLPGTAYSNMAYYPPYLAEALLQRSQKHQGLFRAPCNEDYFLSLAFHALYHKGPTSGLPTRYPEVDVTIDPEHQYAKLLTRLAGELDLPIAVDMENLDAALAERDWRPPMDMLSRLSLRNRWIQRHFFDELKPIEPDRRGLVMFIIRQRAIELGLQDTILRILEARGFHILATKELDEQQSHQIGQRLRGGNWGPGPWPTSGGLPKTVVATCDVIPLPVKEPMRSEQPQVDNARVVSVKLALRKFLNRDLPTDEHANLLHSSDNDHHAWEYVRSTMPEQEAVLADLIRRQHAQFSSRGTVKRDLTRYGSRARIELIEFNGSPAIRKTFRPGNERFLKRELAVMQQLGPLRPEIPPLLDFGDNYFVTPCYEDVMQISEHPNRMLSLDLAKQAINLLRFFYDRGYTIIDFHPGNLLNDRQQGLKIIDFEFVQPYETKPARFEDCYDLAGLPVEFAGDKPELVDYLGSPYERQWLPRIGLSLSSLLNDPRWLQQAKRFQFRARQQAKRAAFRSASSCYRVGVKYGLPTARLAKRVLKRVLFR